MATAMAMNPPDAAMKARALDEYRWRIGIIGIPPPKERRRVIDRHARHQFEPGLSELWLKTEPPGRPLRCGPGRRQHDGQDEGDLAPENAVSRHDDSDRLVMRSQRISPSTKGNPKPPGSRRRIAWRGNRRGSGIFAIRIGNGALVRRIAP